MIYKKIIGLTIGLSVWFIAGQTLAWNSTTIVNNGPTSQKLDIVFLGDGYTEQELTRYKSDVQLFTDYLFNEPPFSDYKKFFNVHRVDVISNESGTDDVCLGNYVNTALNSYRTDAAGGCRSLRIDSAQKVYDAAAFAPARDLILIIVNINNPQSGAAYSAAGYATMYRGDNGPEGLIHEIGHVLGGLADEYEEGGPAVYPGPEPDQPNITMNTVRETLKWGKWVSVATALPTPETPCPTSDVPGLYEGAKYSVFNIYRPTCDSKMRNLYRPFGIVNYNILVDKIFNYIAPDTTSPTSSTTINDGCCQTATSSAVVVNTDANDNESYVRSYRISNSPTFNDAHWLFGSNYSSFSVDMPWSLTTGEGARTVYVETENAYGSTTQTNYTINQINGSSNEIDIGLRAYDDSQMIRIAVEPAGILTSPLRIRKGDTTYGIILVNTTDPAASRLRVQTSSGLKAIKKL